MKRVLTIVLLVSFLMTSLAVIGTAADSEIYLSDLEMESYTKRNDNWEPGIDEVAYYKKTITIAGMEFDKGISMHPLDNGEGNEAECVWDISGLSSKYKYFSAVVGKEDYNQEVGGVSPSTLKASFSSFYVYLDDTLAASETVQFGHYAIINVELNNASKITLKLGDGGDSIYCDCSDFAEAKLSNTMITEADLPGSDLPVTTDAPEENEQLPDNGTYAPDFTKSYVYLSDMNYSDYHVFVGSRGAYLMRDMNVYEEDLFTVSNSFDRGLCMHADTSTMAFAEFDIKDLGYTVFASYIGIADSFAADTSMASAKFIVYVDGVEAYVSEDMTKESEDLIISVDITGASKLKIAVDALGSNSGDWCVFGNPVIGKYASAEEVYAAIDADVPTSAPTAEPTEAPVPTDVPPTEASATEVPTSVPDENSGDKKTDKKSGNTGLIVTVIAVVAVVAVIAAIIIIKNKKGKK